MSLCLHAGAASRDAEIAKLKEQNWELISEKAPALVAVRKERDQLREQVAMLRDVVVTAKGMIAHPDNIAILDKALEATETKK